MMPREGDYRPYTREWDFRSLSAFPPPVLSAGVANPFHPQVPRTKPFRNATSHVYIAHFIDFTQKVSKQTVTTHQDAMAAAAEKGGDEAQRRAQTGDASTSGPPFGACRRVVSLRS